MTLLATLALAAAATFSNFAQSEDDSALPPWPTPGWQVYCIENKESQGLNVWNRQGSGAGGVMQYMASTFRSHQIEMANALGRSDVLDWDRWNPEQAEILAQWDLDHYRRTQWTVSGC